MHEEIPDELEFQNEEDFDSDGEPLPTEEEVCTIINSIPSYKFEEI